ncbi:hypothetical protein [Parasutterella muris]|uniref:hypothetical protein n=1 Tax=Parasutterella muris TaxID=2565572 RepID=UPI00203E343F|nr:hypothetical protein [Parasutterella muris]
MKKLLALSTASLLILLAAPLTFAQNPANSSKDSDGFKEITPIEEEIKQLKFRLDILYEMVTEHRKRLPNQVDLTPSTENFTVLNTGVGQIIASFKSIKPHASGAEFSIGVINIASVPLTDVEFDAEVFPTNGKWEERREAQMLSKQKGITLPVGKEVKVTFRVPEIKPESFKSFTLQAFVGGISYKK